MVHVKLIYENFEQLKHSVLITRVKFTAYIEHPKIIQHPLVIAHFEIISTSISVTIHYL